MESAIDMSRRFFITLNGEQCILFSHTVFIAKGRRETHVSKTKNTYFQVKTWQILSICYTQNYSVNNEPFILGFQAIHKIKNSFLASIYYAS